LTSFFENYIVDLELSEELLKKSLFDQSVKKLGNLTYEEIYFFTPALVLGGGEDIKYINKGIGSTHQLVLHQVGQ
jgi:hypothetical protein